jgi:hypothetical protein
MISRLNVNAGFDSDEICDRFRLEGSIPGTGTVIWKMKMCNRETTLEVDVLVNPPTTIYEFRQTSAVCISVSLSGLGAWVITSE